MYYDDEYIFLPSNVENFSLKFAIRGNAKLLSSEKNVEL